MIDAELLRKLQSEIGEQIRDGIDQLASQLSALEGADFDVAVQALMGLFYADPLDHPDLAPVLDRAEEVLAAQGERALRVILGSLGESDLKAHFRLASTLGRMGATAVAALVRTADESPEEYGRIFALYALGKVKDPAALQAVPLLFRALLDGNPEVRDTAARTLGKVFERATPETVSEPQRREAFDRLLTASGDRYAGVRSKAIRSLAKMAKAQLLSPDQRGCLESLVTRILGEDDAANWDPAYVVRAEAGKIKAAL